MVKVLRINLTLPVPDNIMKQYSMIAKLHPIMTAAVKAIHEAAGVQPTLETAIGTFPRPAKAPAAPAPHHHTERTA